MDAGELAAKGRREMTVSARSLAERWASALAGAVSGMTGEAPPVSVRESAPPAEGVLWWRQKYSLGEGVAVWAGATRESWFGVGAAALAAAGIETTEPVDARNTWFELLSQASAVLASELGRKLGTEVSAGDSGEGQPPEAGNRVFEVQMGAGGAQRISWVAFPDALLAALEPKTVGDSLTSPAPQRDTAAAAGPGNTPKSLDLLLDVELPVSVSFGRAQLPLKDVLKLTTGAIIELNRSINEPVELLVNNSVIARGEVVVIEGNYGIRIQEIVSREHRMRTLR